MKTNRLEGEVKAGIEAYLNLRPDVWMWRANTGAAQLGRFFVRFGLPGQADFLGLQAPSGRFVGIETKREKGGRLSEDQKRWGAMVTAAGGLYIVATCTADVEKGLGPVLGRIDKTQFEPKRVVHR